MSSLKAVFVKSGTGTYVMGGAYTLQGSDSWRVAADGTQGLETYEPVMIDQELMGGFEGCTMSDLGFQTGQ